MNQSIEFVSEGTVTTPVGFQAGATFAGIKTYAKDKLDIGILYSNLPCSSAAVFTTNRIQSPSVVLTRDRVKKGGVRAAVVNSGIANVLVGKQGYDDALEMGDLAAKNLGLPQDEVAVLSTGIIGVEQPMALIRAAVPKIEISESGGNSFARAIMTTDTNPKEAAISYVYDERKVVIGGVVKGSGMIHPNMATMLAFLSTDAPVDADFLQDAISESADFSFNMITIDGDTSTNDTVLLLANGAAGGPTIKKGSKEASLFKEALRELCIVLAKEIVRDGEGASKLFEVTVGGAVNDEDARIGARAIASSSLVKTAVYGSDPNWGRIIAALGRSGSEIDEEKIALYINGVCIMENGLPVPFFKDSVVLLMKGTEISFRVELNLGQGVGTAWGCDLSEGYVRINSAYTT